MDKKYNHQLVEKERYQKWLAAGLFKANVTSKKPKFSLILPPPNVTGQLHLGHAWDGALQDLLIRYKRLQGFECLFVPGMDHAGIATQVKVLERIKSETNIVLKKLDQTTFLDYAWKWKTEYATIIRKQWAKLGLSLDYSCEKFSLDTDISAVVTKVFVDLYHRNLIYQGVKIVNWDPELKTAISNIEVIYKPVKGKLYYLKYYLENNSKQYLTVATTRPETMFADQALFVNSKDARYQAFINKVVINPVNKAKLKVIADDYVDLDFASGVMKCTPAHDFNDYELACKYNLNMPLCFDEAGFMNELAGKYQGLERFACRKQVINDLQNANLVVKIDDYEHQVGYSERTNTVVEPYLSKQWFIKMAPAIDLIKKHQKETVFFPVAFEKQLLTWVNNLQDWCISRQLWWGHKIPVWYHKTNKTIYVDVIPPQNIQDYQQDPDVLDTWFSSALWPMLTLLLPNQNAKYQDYFPTSILVTAYDILFFWVVRMLFMSLTLTGQSPFRCVLIHGLIRDEQGRKMSKSLNNGINPLIVIEEYGADALRYFLITNCAPGQDLRFSTNKIKASWNLINKLWNAARYVLLQTKAEPLFTLKEVKLTLIDQWILMELQQLTTEFHKNMTKYEFIIASHDLANFIWNRYCSWYIELSKYNLQDKTLRTASLTTLWYCLKQILLMLHPFIPFVTEEIYQLMGYKTSIMNENYPQDAIDITYSDANITWFANILIAIISAVREVRITLNLASKISLTLHLNTQDELFLFYKKDLNQYLKQLTNAEIITITNNSLVATQKISKIINNAIIEIATTTFVDATQELQKWQAELVKIDNEIKRSNNILNNKNFLAKAPATKIAVEVAKLKKYQQQFAFLKTKIANFNNNEDS